MNHASKSILLVEDDEIMRTVTGLLLKAEARWQVMTADSAAALKLIKDYSRKIDLLITDVAMPRMTGPELAHIAKQIRPDILVIFMSGHSPSTVKGYEDSIVNAGFLQKPFSRKELLSLMRAMLGNARG